MSASESNDAPPPPPSGGNRPEELPPVEPPSAGYIVQLFLIPALIVAAVIGVWALFGKLAESETDWTQLVAELGSSNEHRRWRAALGLAQILRNQQLANDPSEATPLADQPEVAEALTKILRDSFASNSTLDEEIKHQEFLARTLGALHADEIVLPVLAESLRPERDPEVRKSGLMSLAMIAGRHFIAESENVERLNPDRVYDSTDDVVTLKAPLEKPTIQHEEVWKQLKLAARDEEPGIRHLAAFVMGQVSGDDAIAQLELILLDGDSIARANAAVGLARNGQVSGVPTLIELLVECSTPLPKTEFQKLSDEEKQKQLRQRQFEEPVILSNCLRAVDSIWSVIDPEQQQKLIPIVEKIAKGSTAADIRMQARNLVSRVTGK